MKILRLEMNNIINFENVIIDFQTKKKYKEGNFDGTFKIDNINILKKVGIIGINSSGKTTIINFINLFLYVNKNYFHSLLLERIKKNLLLNITNIEFDLNKTFLRNGILEEEFISNIWKNIISIFNYSENEPIILSVEIYDEIKKEKIHIKIIINNEKPIIDIFINEDKKTINILNDIQKYISKYLFENGHKLDINKFFRAFVKISNLIKEKKTIFPNYENLFTTIQSHPTTFFNPLENLLLNKNNNITTIMRKISKSNKLNEKEIKNKLIKWIRIADPSIVDLLYNEKTNSFSSFINVKNQKIDINMLSTGTTKWLSLFDILFYSKSELIIFDEIENSLHPKLIRYLIDIIGNIDKQILFTTHNPLSFNKKFRPDGLYYIEKDFDGNSNLFRVSDEMKIERNHSMSEMIKKEIIGSHPDINDMYDFFEILRSSKKNSNEK